MTDGQLFRYRAACWLHPDPQVGSWPRRLRDGTPMGLDLKAPGKRAPTVAEDVRRLVLRQWERSPMARARLDPAELVQEVVKTILSRNYGPGAYDPRRGCPSTYVHQVTRSRIDHLLESQRCRRWLEVQTDMADLEEEPAGEVDGDGAIDALEELVRAIIPPPVESLVKRALRTAEEARRRDASFHAAAARWLRRPRQLELVVGLAGRPVAAPVLAKVARPKAAAVEARQGVLF